MHIRKGECNQCGECCGYPRSTDGRQNNPWDTDMLASVRNWSIESLESELPILKILGILLYRGSFNGMVDVYGKRCYWIYVPGHGICTDKTPHGDMDTFDQRCPFLDKKHDDGTVPCLLYSTKEKYVWDKLCQPVPPHIFDRQRQVDEWFTNCPSCSYQYEAITIDKD